jgi:uncharacterized membrane protein YGL010W
MSKIDSYFQDYMTFHETEGNRRAHILGIPLIVIAILSWASHWVWLHSPATEPPASLFQLDLGVAIIVAASIWYCTLDWKLALAFAPVLYGFYWVGRACSVEVASALFIVGWIFQGVGHAVFEKKAPAFTKSIEHLLVGPIWIFVKILQVETGSNNRKHSK